MRILHYSRYFPFPVVHELTLQQINMGHEVSVACWPGISKLPKGVTLYDGIKVNCFGIDIYSNPIKFRLVPFKLLRMFNDVISLSNMFKSFDIVHIHGPTFFIYPQLYSKTGFCEWGVSKRLTGISTIWTYHGQTMLIDKYRNAIEKEMKYADICTAVNKQVADELKITYVPNGVNTNKFKPLTPKPERTKFGLPEDKIILLYVARWIPRKGHDRLIRCLEHLDFMTLRKLFVLFVGPTDVGYMNYYTNALTHLKNLGVNFRTTYVSSDQLPIIYNLADIFCLTSRDEGYPLVLLEAMASGLPTIILKGNYPVDVKSAIITENCKEFAEKLYDLVYQEDLRKLGMEARTEALQYDWAKINQIYLNMYLTL